MAVVVKIQMKVSAARKVKRELVFVFHVNLGTVRGILALLVIGITFIACAAIAILSAIGIATNTTAAWQIVTAMLGVSGVVITFYFMAKSQDTAMKQVVDANAATRQLLDNVRSRTLVRGKKNQNVMEEVVVQ